MTLAIALESAIDRIEYFKPMLVIANLPAKSNVQEKTHHPKHWRISLYPTSATISPYGAAAYNAPGEEATGHAVLKIPVIDGLAEELAEAYEPFSKCQKLHPKCGIEGCGCESFRYQNVYNTSKVSYIQAIAGKYRLLPSKCAHLADVHPVSKRDIQIASEELYRQLQKIITRKVSWDGQFLLNKEGERCGWNPDMPPPPGTEHHVNGRAYSVGELWA